MLRKNPQGYWMADLRADGGPRVSLHTMDKDTARVLHNEVEQRVLKGERVDREVVRALTTSLTVMRSTIKGARPAAPAEPVSEPRPSAGITLRRAFELARVRHEDWRTSKSPRTIEENFRHVADHFGDARLLGSITSSDTSAYRDTLLRAGKSGSTINQRLSLLSVLFKVAEDLFDETGDPSYAVERPRMRRVKVARPRFRVLSRAEEERVHSFFRFSPHPLDATMADLVCVLLDTGFRLSEALRLGPGTVDWERLMVRAVDTKNGDPREVPMSARVRAILASRPAGQLAFAGLTVDRADARWSAMRQAIGLGHDKQFVIHALRHTCCTRMVAAGIDSLRVQHWMGHKNIATTVRYVTLNGDALRGVTETLDRLTVHATASAPQSAGEASVEGEPMRVRIECSTGTDC